MAEKSGYEGMTGVDAIVLEINGATTVLGSRGTAELAAPKVAHLVQRERRGGDR